MASAFFMGNGGSSLDGKGRFALPAAFRSVLADHSEEPGSMLVRADPTSRCLTLFGSKQVAYFQGKADEDAKFSSVRDFDRDQESVDFWSSVRNVTIDSGGRFSLPPTFKRLFGIDEALFIVGGGRFCQLWSAERFLAENPNNLLAIEECETFLEDHRSKREGRA